MQLPCAFYTLLLDNNYQLIREDAVSTEESQTLENPFNGCPEARLILACSRTSINAEISSQIKELLQGELNWEYIITNAQLNGVTPLLCQNLLNTHAELIPEKFLDWLRRFSKEHKKNSLFQMMELLKVIQLLEQNGVPTLPLKGPTLAHLIYGNVALRQFCDLDILVHKKDIQKAMKLLLDQGYELYSLPSWFERLPTLASRKKDVALVNENKQVRIELHWRLSGTHFDMPLSTESLWKGMDQVLVAGQPVRVLPLNDLLLYLTMHGSRHGWMRLIWICDIAELIRVHQDINWEVLMQQARTLGCERTLNLGLCLANSLLQTPLPEAVFKQVETGEVIQPIAAQVRESLFNKNHLQQDISYWSMYHLAMKERLRERLRVRLHYFYRYFHLAITPNENDYSLIDLPDSLSFLYYILRPWRFAYEFSARVFKRNRKEDAPNSKM